MSRKVFFVAAILSLFVLVANPRPANEVRAMSPEPPETGAAQATAATNLLANPEFDDYFYWRPTNHLVANMWYEWFWAAPYRIPEFIDGGHPYHNQCYPPPAGGVCETAAQHNGSQGYILMAAAFVAGVYQPVQVTMCGLYQFQAYNRNDAKDYHPQVGIDPTGQVLPPYVPPDGEGLPLNCPPDGHSKCPNPGISDPSKLPPHIVWSAPVNPPARAWTPISVTAEAISTTISVWTYAAPETGGSQSTYWDHASLVQVLPPSGFLTVPVTLPSADGFIANAASSTTAIRANLSWQTSQPALTQVLYHWVGDAGMTMVPPIVTSASAFESHTAPGSTSSTVHSARLTSLLPHSIYDYAILARHVVGNACQTSVLTGRFSTTDVLLPPGPLPAPSSDIVGPIILTSTNSAYVIWQSAKPSYAQVLYRYEGVTSTIYPTMTNQGYLPLIMRGGYGSTSDYESRTPPDLTLSTLHVIQLTGLQPDSPYGAVAVSAWSEGEVDKTALSAHTSFRTGAAYAAMAANVSPDQLVEQLQVCLSDGNTLNVCVAEATK